MMPHDDEQDPDDGSQEAVEPAKLGQDAPADERPDEAKRRERPDAIPPRAGTAEQVQGYVDLAREREAELPPEKRKQT